MALSIGFIVPSFDQGGLEQIVWNLYQAAIKTGNQVTIFVENGQYGHFASLLPDDAIVFIQQSRTRFFSELMNRQIQCLHYNYSTFCLEEARSIGIGCVYCLHNVYTWFDDEAFAYHFDTVAKANKIIAVSDFVARYATARSGLLSNRFSVIPNGVDVSTLHIIPPLHPEAFDLDPDYFYFGVFASFHRVKLQKSLISIAEDMANQGLQFRILLAGGEGDPAFYNEFTTSHQASSANEFILPLGQLSHEQAIGLLKGVVDCTILTTAQEGSSNAAIEAVACGVPLIATDVGSSQELHSHTPKKVTIVPPPADIMTMNAAKIEALSRLVQSPNHSQILRAMKDALSHGKRNKQRNESMMVHNEFPFSAEKMSAAHLAALKETID